MGSNSLQMLKEVRVRVIPLFTDNHNHEIIKVRYILLHPNNGMIMADVPKSGMNLSILYHYLPSYLSGMDG
jgi:hypothetical protein